MSKQLGSGGHTNLGSSIQVIVIVALLPCLLWDNEGINQERFNFWLYTLHFHY
jgi:hypothetical protein